MLWSFSMWLLYCSLTLLLDLGCCSWGEQCMVLVVLPTEVCLRRPAAVVQRKLAKWTKSGIVIHQPERKQQLSNKWLLYREGTSPAVVAGGRLRKHVYTGPQNEELHIMSVRSYGYLFLWMVPTVTTTECDTYRLLDSTYLRIQEHQELQIVAVRMHWVDAYSTYRNDDGTLEMTRVPVVCTVHRNYFVEYQWCTERTIVW